MSKVLVDWDTLNAWHWSATLVRNGLLNAKIKDAIDCLDDLIYSLNEKRGI